MLTDEKTTNYYRVNIRCSRSDRKERGDDEEKTQFCIAKCV